MNKDLIQQEIMALRRIPEVDYLGEPLEPFAYGERFLALDFDSAPPKRYDFSIKLNQQEQQLELELDLYSPSVPQSQWDVDEWEKRKFHLHATPPDRRSLRALSRIARSLLNGRDVVMPSGALLRGVKA